MDHVSRHFLLALLMMFLSNRLALEVYKFNEGQDVSIDFTQRMSSNSTFEYELYLRTTYRGCYFCKNGTMVPGCLTLLQSRRFSVRSKRTSTELTITLSIDKINSKDSQYCLFALREDNSDKSHSFTQDIQIKVVRPLGPAKCTVKTSENLASWNEVSCTSLLASDGEGSLYCFQDGEKVPHKGSPLRINDHVTQVFWMNVRLPINCCSYKASFPLTSALCSQFMYSIPTHTTVSENSKNPSSSRTAPGTTVPQTSAQITSSEKLSTESKNTEVTTPKTPSAVYGAIALGSLFSVATALPESPVLMYPSVVRYTFIHLGRKGKGG
ncbi:uncharacterized protein [Diadema setosum]|uniref:uncharacterized protein n=1 Tax=Diadema setosum TaxID=31175 RepID=UPI003B3A0533